MAVRPLQSPTREFATPSSIMNDRTGWAYMSPQAPLDCWRSTSTNPEENTRRPNKPQALMPQSDPPFPSSNINPQKKTELFPYLWLSSAPPTQQRDLPPDKLSTSPSQRQTDFFPEKIAPSSCKTSLNPLQPTPAQPSTASFLKGRSQPHQQVARSTRPPGPSSAIRDLVEPLKLAAVQIKQNTPATLINESTEKEAQPPTQCSNASTSSRIVHLEKARPISQRPETTDVVARRMIASALGINLAKRDDERSLEIVKEMSEKRAGKRKGVEITKDQRGEGAIASSPRQ